MDYSTFSNKTTFTEAEELTNGELGERYYLLKKQFENLSHSFEALQQELHEAKRNYQTAVDVQSHLTVELETYQAEEKKRTKELNNKITSLQEEITTLREERSETVEHHASEIKKYEEEIRHLKEEQAIEIELQRRSPEKDDTELVEAKEALNAAKAALEEAKVEIGSWRMRAEELVSEIAEMREAAELRREELRAAGEREATALAELAEARAMLHHCTDSPDLQPHAAKGNSIFAEVEDKRQEMAKNLIQMKQTNARLRRELAAKQSELEALLHEKQTVWELQAGAAAHYDQELIESYSERITQLEGQCERQRRELCRWFGRQCDPAAPGWLPAVLEHFKSECEQLRAEVLSQGAAQLASAAQVRELRRKNALLSASGARQSIASPAQTESSVVKDDIGVKPIQIKHIPTPDDVKKKVSFN